MIICSNCGTTNNEQNGRICRKCGALLPISVKPSRTKSSSKKSEKPKIKEQRTPPEKKKSINKPKKQPANKEFNTAPKVLDLHEIPKTGKRYEDKYSKVNDENDFSEPEDDAQILTEIQPQPFRGSIIADKGVYGHHQQTERVTNSSTQKIPSASKTESSLIKQKQLEEDMTKVLSFLSKKVTVKPLESAKKVDEVKKKPEEVIPPSSMTEILKDLLKLDLHIEASAIIKKDGTILASAISSRISDSLFATVGQNLSMIGTDIIEGLSAGNLLNISIRGTNGVLDLAPIGSKETLGDDMILIIFSHPRVKSGIINLAASNVRKQVTQYLGLSK
jgi:predicted regulator of Ras-like GTPase activity (Roadblock/LC7/MglB family)